MSATTLTLAERIAKWVKDWGHDGSEREGARAAALIREVEALEATARDEAFSECATDLLELMGCLSIDEPDSAKREKMQAIVDKIAGKAAHSHLSELVSLRGQVASLAAERDGLVDETRALTINYEESQEVCAELFQMCCAVLDGDAKAQEYRRRLTDHIAHVKSCGKGSCEFDQGITAIRTRAEKAEAERDALREALPACINAIERMYDHLKAKAGDVELVYALRAVNKARRALAGGDE